MSRDSSEFGGRRAALVRDVVARTGGGRGLALLMVDASDDRLLGSIGLHEPHYGERRCEIGYWLAPEARGGGFMTRAVRLFAAWIFDSLASYSLLRGELR